MNSRIHRIVIGEIMLPERSEARRTVAFLRDARFADKVAVSISAAGENADTLHAASIHRISCALFILTC